MVLQDNYTFVNQPAKGCEIFFPATPFSFVFSWRDQRFTLTSLNNTYYHVMYIAILLVDPGM